MIEYSVVELIRKTRDGKELTGEELAYLVKGFSEQSLPDYQISAWLMAVYLKGLSTKETFVLTKLMRESGEVLDWKKDNPAYRGSFIVDKHSSGGIGDKVSFVLLSLCASMGMKVPMMGGRGLGHTGGTVDKLDSIPGFRSELSIQEVKRAFEEVGCYIIGQSSSICPADKKLYSLRDVTGTIESLELITASIVSKKWAEGLDAIVYDVKCGSAAFMATLEDARNLAKSLVAVSKQAGMAARALITHMEEPLGAFVGNSVEILESLAILENNYKTEKHLKLALPLKKLCLDLAAHMAVLSGCGKELAAMRVLAEQKLESGAAAEKFRAMLRIHGAQDDWENKLPLGKNKFVLRATQNAGIAHIHSRTLGLVGISLGMGRRKTDDKLNYGIGFEMHVACGETVGVGQELLTLYYDGSPDLKSIEQELAAMFVYGKAELRDNLIIEIVD